MGLCAWCVRPYAPNGVNAKRNDDDDDMHGDVLMQPEAYHF